MKVSINAGGREVSIETLSDQNLTHAEVVEKALEIWKQTDGATNPSQGPAYGFQGERPGSPGYLPYIGEGKPRVVEA